MTDLYTRHGGIPPFGILVSQTWNEIGAILHIINTYHVDLFVEIGAHRGGLGSLLIAREEYDEKFLYIGIEIDPDVLNERFDNHVANVFIGNVFDVEYFDMLKGYVNIHKVPLIYCDGGDKPREFKVFSKILPKGGLIMVHDYPKEFREEHFKDTELTRLDLDFLGIEGNRQILFRC